MANQSRLISGGVNYYIEGGGKYTGSGTPWTAVGTSPYGMAMNDVAGTAYTPTAATRQEVYGGGPPFRNGQTLIYDSYGNVTETVTIQCRANSHDNAVTLLQQLRRILNTALFTTPCQLAYQPNGATSAVYFEIYGADVQEDQRFVNSEAGAVAAGNALVRAVVTWRRSPHGGLLATGETLLSASSFGNTGTGSPDNIVPYSAGAGDLIYEGSPLNLKFTPTSSTIRDVYLASIDSRVYDTSGAAVYSSSSTTDTGTLLFSPAFTITPKMTSRAMKMRVIMRFSSSSAIAQVRVRGSLQANQTIYSGPWVTTANSGATYYLDLGAVPLDFIRRSQGLTAPTINLSFYMRSTTGASASLTVSYVEVLFYYDFAIATFSSGQSFSGTNYLLIDTFAEQSGYPCLPHAYPQAFQGNGTDMLSLFVLRGTPPRYYSGASLYAAWTNLAGAHSTAATATVTARHAPQWGTLRGAN